MKRVMSGHDRAQTDKELPEQGRRTLAEARSTGA
jgi:hypothetical protein